MIELPPEATITRNLRRESGDTVLRPEPFQPYVQQLAELLNSARAFGVPSHQKEFIAALDGQPGFQLRKLYSIDDLRSTGTYFTGSDLAGRLVLNRDFTNADLRQIVDPACGAGDLLVACARFLPICDTLIETLRAWGTRLAGFDLNPAFVEATRYRLALLALARITSPKGEESCDLPLAELFPNIRSGSGMKDWNLHLKPSLIVLNPPFCYAQGEELCRWSSGQVSQAATFLESCIEKAPVGARILAILPDVLRAGTRYEQWRRMVAEKACIRSVEIIGQFDKITDVSVFLMELEVGIIDGHQHIDWARPLICAQTLKDAFDIRVGPVVPFRLDGKGPWLPYADSEKMPPWEIVRSLNRRVRFKGTTYKPPFVVIRRTSKADSPVRCIGTLVTGNEPIAVENHLIIALSHDKKVGTCKRLLDFLRLKSTSDWMNERIRCRHLTVGSVRDLPWPEV